MILTHGLLFCALCIMFYGLCTGLMMITCWLSSIVLLPSLRLVLLVIINFGMFGMWLLLCQLTRPNMNDFENIVWYVFENIVRWVFENIVWYVFENIVRWVFENIVVGYSADIVQTLLTGLLCDTVRLCSPVYFGRLFCLGRRVPCQPPYVDPATDPAHANTTLALCSVK